jgi:hypothetical protein
MNRWSAGEYCDEAEVKAFYGYTDPLVNPTPKAQLCTMRIERIARIVKRHSALWWCPRAMSDRAGHSERIDRPHRFTAGRQVQCSVAC